MGRDPGIREHWRRIGRYKVRFISCSLDLIMILLTKLLSMLACIDMRDSLIKLLLLVKRTWIFSLYVHILREEVCNVLKPSICDKWVVLYDLCEEEHSSNLCEVGSLNICDVFNVIYTWRLGRGLVSLGRRKFILEEWMYLKMFSMYNK